MAKVRKDLRGRSLRKGEVQRSSDKRYMYTYTDPMGRRKFIYANDLAELREKEAKLMKDQLDGLDLYVAGKASVNDTFDRYMSTKYNLRESTKSSYLYTYDHYVRDTFGKKRIADIKYSDVLQFYYYLLNEVKIALDMGQIDLHAKIRTRIGDRIIQTTVGRLIIHEILPSFVPANLWNKILKKKDIGILVDYIYKEAGYEVTPRFLDDLKNLGFKYA
jgi:hypothetical protein